MKTALNAEVPIVDNEISNDISSPAGQPWRYEEGDIICCGVFYGNSITIILREKGDDINLYKKKLKEFLDKLPTMYAFNFNMEKGNFLGFLGKKYFIEEIKPFKARGGSKQAFYEELLKDNKIPPKSVPEDPLKNDSEQVLNKYAENDYEAVILHNLSDVVKQYFIWKNKNYLLEKYKDNLDGNGWYQGVFRE